MTVVPLAVTVLVTTDVAVVDAVQPDQVVQGADFVPHGPFVQPGDHVSIDEECMERKIVVLPDHVLGGQAEVPHQLVHAPDVNAPLSLAHGPQPWPAPWPKGPHPPVAVQPAGGAPEPQGAPVMVDQAELVVIAAGHEEPPLVALYVASGEAVTVVPAFAQSCATVSYIACLSVSLQLELAMHLLAVLMVSAAQ